MTAKTTDLRSSSLMQTVPIRGCIVSPDREVVVERLTVKHSSSSSILSEIMETVLQSDESLSSRESEVYVYV